MVPEPSTRPSRLWRLVLLVPYVGLLWPALYAHQDPAIAGIPFFYWYQFAFIAVSAALTALVYHLERRG